MPYLNKYLYSKIYFYTILYHAIRVINLCSNEAYILEGVVV